ncbi:Cupin domain protein [Halogranum amylolyticum]|uniref:Cupin domain protein n=1 Tax=Halogranum amylolyticum TaxID=660520 RepID=A0A1H8SGC4_9EURY|nr:cupin domain-containing protein [Halogranum amylolyticum]SEO77625.1 Cupin domain protein [Halogranum amylolyticum]
MSKSLLGPGEGMAGHVFGLDMTRRVSGDDTNGAYFALEFELPPGEEIPPHIHHNEEEILYVIDGEIESRVGEETHKALAGACRAIPRGTVHAQANHGRDPATLLVIFSPPHLEELFERSAEVTPEEFQELAADYGMEPVE